MTPERADQIEIELRRAAMSGPIDDRQRLIGLGLEALAGYRRAADLHIAAHTRCHELINELRTARRVIEILESP
jgi:hypothetical protein